MIVSLSAAAQLKFYAAITPDHSAKDEYVTLSFTIENGSGDGSITPPSLRDFELVSGPNQFSGMSYTNHSQMHSSVTVSYVLLPKRAGTIRIAPATIAAGGKTYESNAVTLTVSNKNLPPGAARNNQLQSFLQMPSIDPYDAPQNDQQYDDYILRKGENARDKVNKSMQLKLVTDKTSCYAGEPIVATYKLYSRLRSESNLSKNPSFNGFSVVDMTRLSEPEVGHEKLNGRDFNVYLIRKAQLYPLQSGNIELETASVDNRVTFAKTERNNGGPVNLTETVTLSSKPVMVNVKPLPEEGKPAGFKDAVGNFEIRSSLTKTNFSSDETGVLLVTISGSGNMQLLTAPEIKWPASLDPFDAKVIDHTNEAVVPISGNKTFEIPFSVNLPGDYVIPAISFSFFNPATASYKTVTAKEISFHVSRGAGRKKPVLTGNTTEPSSGSGLFSNRMIIIILLALIIIAAVIFWMNREEKKAKKNFAAEQEKKEKEIIVQEPVYSFAAVNPLAKTEDCLNRDECVEFYSILNSEFKEFLSKKYHIPAEQLHVKSLGTAMDKAGADNNLILQTQALLQETDRLLYTPFEQDEKLHEMYAKAQTIIQLLNMRRS